MLRGAAERLMGATVPQDGLPRLKKAVWEPRSDWLDPSVCNISFIYVSKGKVCTLLKAIEVKVEIVQQ